MLGSAGLYGNVAVLLVVLVVLRSVREQPEPTEASLFFVINQAVTHARVFVRETPSDTIAP